MSGTRTNLHSRIFELAQIQSEVLGAGVTREVYTPAYALSVELIAGWMREAGLETRVDAVGNLFGRWLGSSPDLPRVMSGSHFDTTLNAGRYDGVLGVLGAIEAGGNCAPPAFSQSGRSNWLALPERNLGSEPGASVVAR